MSRIIEFSSPSKQKLPANAGHAKTLKNVFLTQSAEKGSRHRYLEKKQGHSPNDERSNSDERTSSANSQTIIKTRALFQKFPGMATKTIKKENSTARNKLASPMTKTKPIQRKEAKRRFEGFLPSEPMEEGIRATSFGALEEEEVHVDECKDDRNFSIKKIDFSAEKGEPPSVEAAPLQSVIISRHSHSSPGEGGIHIANVPYEYQTPPQNVGKNYQKVLFPPTNPFDGNFVSQSTIPSHIRGSSQYSTRSKAESGSRQPSHALTGSKSFPGSEVPTAQKSRFKTVTLNMFNSFKLNEDKQLSNSLGEPLKNIICPKIKIRNPLSFEIAPASNKKITCSCRKSRCLKLYCECLAANKTCENCNCSNCGNTDANEEERKAVILTLMDKNPDNFRQRYPQETLHLESDLVLKHKKGCNCRKSGCLKKYCECYQAGAICSEACKCMDCCNKDANQNSNMTPNSNKLYKDESEEEGFPSTSGRKNN